jgi:hypothetical protein
MAIDHLIGTEDEPGDEAGLADPAAFASASRCRSPSRPSTSASSFGVRRGTIPIGRRGRRSSAGSWRLGRWRPRPALSTGRRRIALGLLGRCGSRAGVATAAVAIGALALALGAGAYVVALLA